jgi:protocatechuate 3,4-dioxygenase beta subunit
MTSARLFANHKVIRLSRRVAGVTSAVPAAASITAARDAQGVLIKVAMPYGRLGHQSSTLAAIALAALGVTQVITAQPTYAELEGVLLTRGSDQPVGRATVRLVGQQSYTAVSSSDGVFSFSGIAPGRYELTAARAGYVAAVYRHRGTPIINLSAGQKHKIAFQLTQCAVIAGRVIDENGDPLTLARVSADRLTHVRGMYRFLKYSPPVPVDDRGQFRIANVTPGTYVVSARPDQHARDHEKRYVTTYYPNATDITQAARVTAHPGSEVNIAIPIRKEQVFRVEGTVVDSLTDRPAAKRFLVELHSTVPGSQLTHSVAIHYLPDDGTFHFLVPAGSYILVGQTMAVKTDLGEAVDAPLFGQHPIMVSDRDVLDVKAVFRSTIDIEGLVRTADGPKSGERTSEASVKVATPIRIELLPVTPLGRAITTTVNENGAFQLRSVPPGRYRVRVSGLPLDDFIQAIAFGRDEILNGILDVATASERRLHVLTSSGGARVSGRVRGVDSDPVPGVRVTLAPRVDLNSDVPVRLSSVTSDSDGRFSFDGLSPGEYAVLAWEDVDPNLAMNPHFYASVIRLGAFVELSKGGTRELELNLVSTADVDLAETKLLVR